MRRNINEVFCGKISTKELLLSFTKHIGRKGWVSGRIRTFLLYIYIKRLPIYEPVSYFKHQVQNSVK